MIETPQTLPHPADEATAMLLAMAHEGARATERVAMAPDGAHAIERVAMSHDGARVLVADGELVQFADGRVLMRGARARALALVEGEAWVIVEDGGEHTLHRFDAAGDPLEPALPLGRLGANLRIAATRVGVHSALIEGDRAVFVREQVVEDLGERGRDRRVLIGGRGVAERRGGALVFRRTGTIALPGDLTAAVVVSGAMVFDGSAALIELERTSHRTAVVVDPRRGGVHTRIRLGEAAILAVAERKGLVVLGRGAHVALFDLRAGRCVGERILPAPVRASAIDADGTRLIALDATGTLHTLAASMANWSVPATTSNDTEPVRGSQEAAPDRDEDGNAASRDGIELHRSEPPDDGVGEHSEATGHAERESSDGAVYRDDLASDARGDHDASQRSCSTTVSVDDARREVAGDVPRRDDLAGDAECDRDPSARSNNATVRASKTDNERMCARDAGDTGNDARSAPEIDPLVAVQGLRLRALGPAVRRMLPPDKLEAYLADGRAWVVSLCRTALATAHDTGRLGGAAPAEIDSVLGDHGGHATDELVRAHQLEEDATQRFSRWNRRGAPHVEIARELRLSPMAMSLLLLAAAPQIWGELARAYGLCVADRARPLVDELLLAHLLEADTPTRAAIGRELDEDAPLIASGAVIVARGLRPYAAISVHPAIARRLVGALPAGDRDDGSALADRALTKIIGPRAQIAEVARRLARRSAIPVRVVLRGRPNVGRRTSAAALAALAGRRIGLVTIDGGAKDLEVQLAQRLHDVSLRGDLPCVTLDGLADDPALRARIRPVLDRHLGPLFIRSPRGGDLPLAPGYLAIDFIQLTETERHAAWETMLAAHELDLAPAASLAARFHVGPGAMARACTAATAIPVPAPANNATASATLEATLASALRQHRSARIEATATRVERLASWDDLIVPDDISDALHELCARVRHRRTVLEDWGMRGVAATAQGTTALFQGAPGTGKTMAAEVIANALGYELWRVDLSKVVSKWIGETEKNLAAVFDAAEDGEIVLLFDEADSLFGKRTEVKSSHDRNANLETNYLLQRLDSFTGIAILTTNFGTAIDPAFLRRVSVHVQFPLPDELERERLWRAVLPRTLPFAGEPDLAELARRYPLTGGYIRNAVLRAAYVAAGRGTPLSTTDLERAVRAEYLARGKVSPTGAIT